MRVVTVEEMKAIELNANENGVSYAEMITQAGRGIALIINGRFPCNENSKVVGLVGGGNNGSDTLIALAELQKSGWEAVAVLARDRRDDLLVRDFIEAGGKVILWTGRESMKSVRPVMASAGVIVDGLLGTGITLPLREDAREFLGLIGKEVGRQTVVAVDCPSGVDCESGMVADETIKANLTVCMEAIKTGLIRFPAFEFCGELVTVPIGITKHTKSVENKINVIDREWVSEILPKRPANSHKGTFGTVMVVGGSVNYVGAPMLSGVGAYRMGTGLVALAVPQSIHPMLAGRIPEAIWLVLNEEDGVISEPAADLVISQFSKVNALVIGPGIGREEATDRFLDKVFFNKYSSGNSKRIGFLVEEKIKEDRIKELPEIVVDADGLRWLSANKKWYETVKARMVLTPHPGEMSALTGIPVDEIQKNRMETALEFAQKWGQVVVLKGALTVIAAPDGRVNINPVASSALAKAGSGDVLSGMIASLIGQGLAPFEAASAAVWVHAQAGICAAAMVGDEVSVLASDITDAIPFVLAGLKKNTV